jgi:DNA (cytosine-5)-methyltransferase 1
VTPRPLLLDLFCGTGGAAMGYHRAGFDVIGVDIEPHPEYPFEFHQADAMQVLEYIADRAEPWEHAPYPAAIHASPPCEFATTMSARWRKRGGTVADTHANLLTPTLEILRGLGVPFVVENVPGAKRYMRPTLLLHGGMFGLGVHRPRFFESSELILAPYARATEKPVGVYGDHPQHHYSTRQNGDMKGKRSEFRRARTIDEARELMGMPWADWDGCRKAIPPAYTEYIGRQLVEHLAVGTVTDARPLPDHGGHRRPVPRQPVDRPQVGPR